MKKIMIFIITIIMMLTLVSCNTNNLEEYKNAAKKTDEIKKGQTSAEFSLKINFNTEDLTEEEVKSLNYITDMKGNFYVTYDEDEKKSIYKNYLNLGGLGFDFDIYANGDDVLIKLPIVGKYVDLEQIKNSNYVDYVEYEELEKDIISKNTKEELMKTWLELMNEEDVFKGKDIILTTPDGEVKTTEYTIKLTNEQIKGLINKCIEIVSKDNNIKQSYEKYIKEHSEYLGFEEMITDIKDNIYDYSVEEFSYTALVDIDSYIVSENIKFSLQALNPKFVSEKIDYNLDLKNWNINKKQEFNFPVLTKENTYNMDDIEKNMPNIMEDFLKKNK